jgi:DNA mismatch endonuclease (patch repair protein)
MTPDTVPRHVRSRIMSQIRSADTAPERILRAALIRKGLSGFRLQYQVIGRPDFAFPREKIAIFCDSDFWHGRKPLPASNRSYWKAKMKRNAARDLSVNAKLKAQGWSVIRLSESAIMTSSPNCVQLITKELTARRKGKMRSLFLA